jgi:RNA polymerase sigma-70 factor (ECF subfamily)
MHTIDGFMHKEIAEKLQINENTCRVHYRNAKIKLKELLVKNRIVAVLVFLIIYLVEYQK